MKNTLKLILAGMRIATDKVVAKIPKKLSELELDVNLAKHIKDMYYEEIEYVTYISEQNIELENKYSGRVTTNIPDVDMPWDWVPYRVTFDGVEYESVMTDNADTAWLDVTLNDGTNLWINSYGDISIDSEDYVGRHTIKVEQITNKVHIIDSKYLGFPIHAGTGEDAVYLNNNENIASGDYSYAEGGLTTASGYSSHAEGDRTEASGYASHAEGCHTFASGRSSHAEGDNATASGDYSHAEGMSTTASGNYSHAEGMSTTASGNYSHAEGRGTTVSGRSQHAGGEYNIPEPKFVSAETRIKNSRERICSYRDTLYSSKHGFTYDDVAGLYTFVSLTDGDIETAPQSGERYYIVNGTSGKVVYHQKTYDDIYYDFTNYYAEPGMIKYEIRESATQKGEYAHIVGNGTSDTSRSNAHTLDWEGNAWFSGDVYTGSTSGTNRDEGSKKLATEEYVDDAVANAGGGSVFTVNITENEDDEGNITYSADKTFAEIMEAYENGKVCVAKWSSLYLPLYNDANIEDEFCFMHSGFPNYTEIIVGDGYVDFINTDMLYDFETEALTTTDKTIVGAINELHSKHTEGTDSLTLLSPKGTRFSITVGDDGVLKSTEIVE